MSYLTLPGGSLITINGNALSEHNRQAATMFKERIEQSQRMADGTLRKFFVAEKHTLDLSWSDLPSKASFTVDNKWAALDIKDFYESSTGQASFPVVVKAYGASGDQIAFTGVFTSCSFTMKRRRLSDKTVTVTNNDKQKNVTAVSASSSGITYTASGHSYIIGDKVTVSGFDSDEFDISERPITAVTTNTFTVAQTEGGYSTVTGADQTANSVTYYSQNDFEAGDVITISGLGSNSISSISGDGSVVSITTSSAHGLTAGQYVSIVSTGVESLNLTSVQVASAPTTTTLTIGNAASGSASTGTISLDGFNFSSATIQSATSNTFTINNTGTNIVDLNQQSGTAIIRGINTQSTLTKAYTGSLINITAASSSSSQITYTYTGTTVTNGQNVYVTGLTNNLFNTFGTIVNATSTTFKINTAVASGQAALSGQSGFGHVGSGKLTFVGSNNFNAGDLVSVSGIRNAATITAATELTGGNSGKTTFTTSTQTNAFQAGDIVIISGCVPEEYNITAQVVSSPAPSSTSFTVVFNPIKKLQIGGTAKSIFDITEEIIESATSSQFVINKSYTSSAAASLSGITATVTKEINSSSESSSASSTSSNYYDLWDVSLTIEQV
jgi:hypothetical protein